MKLTATQTDLKRALSRVRHASSPRAILAALYCVLMEAKGDELRLTTTNLDVQISETLPATVERDGEALIPTSRLSDLASRVIATQISIEPRKDGAAGLFVQAGSSQSNLPGVDVKEFATRMQAGTVLFTLPQSQLKGMLSQAVPAVSVDTTRFVLNGVHFEAKGLRLSVVACDGRRLNLSTHDLDAEIENPDFILPTGTVNALISLLDDSDGLVEISKSDSLIGFRFGKTEVISKRVDGTYPNWRKVIPIENDGAIIQREEVIAGLRLSQLTQEEGKLPCAKLSFSKNLLRIAANDKSGDTGHDISLRYTGKPLEISLNPDWMISALNCVSNDEVKLEVMDELSPVVMRVESFVAVVMPMRG